MFEKWLQLFQSHSSVGLTITDYSIRMVVFRGTTDDPSRLDYWEEWLQPGVVENGRVKNEQAFTDQLKDIVHALKAKGKRTYFAIPSSQLILRQLDFPGIKSDSELQNHFFIEIGNKIQLPFEQAVFDFHVISRAATGTKVLLIAAPEAVVLQYRKLQANAGLNESGKCRIQRTGNRSLDAALLPANFREAADVCTARKRGTLCVDFPRGYPDVRPSGQPKRSGQPVD